ncbi:MAG: fatty acid--CoA ligase [Acidimicrobiales bacterium]
MEHLADIARGQAKDRSDMVALIFGAETFTYGELGRRSSRVAAGLQALGVRPQDRVAFLDKNTPEYFDAIFGAAKLNAVLCAVNWRLAPSETAFVLNDTEAKVLIIGHGLLDAWSAIRDQLEWIETVLVIGAGGDVPPGTQSYERWRDSQVAIDPGVVPAADDVALQLYSSGTTGRPKGVMLTNANCFAAIAASNASLGFSDGSVNLVAMPLFHIAGAVWGLFGLYNGVSNVLLREVDPSLVVKSIAEQGVTHAALVPAVIQFILGLPHLDPATFETMEVLVYGASPISEDVLIRALAVFRCRFFQAYGMTETAGACVLLSPEDHDPGGPLAHRLRSAGKASSGTELKIRDPETGKECSTGMVGEVLIRSAQNMKGYWKLPEDTATTLVADGWLRTGDAGYLDEDGYLYIHDRVKDMIISGGENIYPAEVENVLMSCPGVVDAAVIGIPHAQWGETPKALIVRTSDQSCDETSILDYCRRHLAGYKCPTSVGFIDALPRTPSGKVLKRELREPYWAGIHRRVH